MSRLPIHKSKTKRGVALVLVAAIAFPSSSCGTLIHRERWGQKYTGQLDPSIVVLDSLGLLVFVVPGVVGFVVDFATGAIYLPAPTSPPMGYPPPQVIYPQNGTPQPGYAPPDPPQPRYSQPGGAQPGPNQQGATQAVSPLSMTRIQVDPATLDKEKIAAIVREHTGRTIDLDAPNVQVQQVDNMDQASAELAKAERAAQMK